MSMEIGVYTFGDLSMSLPGGERLSPRQRMQNLLEEIKLADEVGLDVFGIGEHHRPDYLVSAPAPILAAAAVLTKNIKLTSAVTVLSSDDPVRVFQNFATVDLLANGRTEIMAGRGSFIESFPLFGYHLGDYDTLFTEKLNLLLEINKSEILNWKGGQHTTPVQGRGIYPRPTTGRMPVWVAVGGTPESVARAAHLGLPMALAIIGGQPARFAPLVQLYKRTWKETGHSPEKIKLGINSIGFVGETERAAKEAFYPSWQQVMNQLGKERGWPPSNRADFEVACGPDGALVLGSPQQVTDKILKEHELFGNTRFLVQMSMGAVPHKQVMRAIELLGTQVAPQVRKALHTTTVG